MGRRTVLCGLAVLMVLGAAPASAAPPERTAIPLAFTGPDFDNDLVIFLNTTRDDYCDEEQVEYELAVAEWLEGGMVGTPPGEDLEPAVGIEAIPAKIVATPKGLIATARASDLYIELWRLDDPGDQLGVDACLDTDDANERVATGTSTFKGFVNDLGGEGLRPTSIDHTQGRAQVSGAGGTYRYTWFFHQHLPCVDGPGPRCEVARFDLRPLR